MKSILQMVTGLVTLLLCKIKLADRMSSYVAHFSVYKIKLNKYYTKYSSQSSLSYTSQSCKMAKSFYFILLNIREFVQ